MKNYQKILGLLNLIFILFLVISLVSRTYDQVGQAQERFVTSLLMLIPAYTFLHYHLITGFGFKKIADQPRVLTIISVITLVFLLLFPVRWGWLKVNSVRESNEQNKRDANEPLVLEEPRDMGNFTNDETGTASLITRYAEEGIHY